MSFVFIGHFVSYWSSHPAVDELIVRQITTSDNKSSVFCIAQQCPLVLMY